MTRRGRRRHVGGFRAVRKPSGAGIDAKRGDGETAHPGPTEASQPRFSRRALVRGGLASLALVAISGTAIALRGTRLASLPAAGLKGLSPGEYSVLAAVARRICPAPRAGVPGADAIDVALLADRLFERADDDARDGVRTAIRIFENGLAGALFLERVTPFTALSPDAQDRTLLAFRDSRVGVRRSLYRALSGLCGSLYYGDPRSWPSVGYPGPPDARALRAAYAGQLVDFAALRAGPRPGGG